MRSLSDPHHLQDLEGYKPTRAVFRETMRYEDITLICQVFSRAGIHCPTYIHRDPSSPLLFVSHPPVTHNLHLHLDPIEADETDARPFSTIPNLALHHAQQPVKEVNHLNRHQGGEG